VGWRLEWKVEGLLKKYACRRGGKEGIKHFYFMSLTKGEFVDATKKGNIERLLNLLRHSRTIGTWLDKNGVALESST
jgi:hypothetical protein